MTRLQHFQNQFAVDLHDVPTAHTATLVRLADYRPEPRIAAATRQFIAGEAAGRDLTFRELRAIGRRLQQEMPKVLQDIQEAMDNGCYKPNFAAFQEPCLGRVILN